MIALSRYLYSLIPDGTVIVLTLPISSKPKASGAFGSTMNTSILSKYFGSLWKSKNRNFTTLTGFMPIKKTKTPYISRFITRWFSVIGWISITYDVFSISECISKCKNERCR